LKPSWGGKRGICRLGAQKDPRGRLVLLGRKRGKKHYFEKKMAGFAATCEPIGDRIGVTFSLERTPAKGAPGLYGKGIGKIEPVRGGGFRGDLLFY